MGVLALVLPGVREVRTPLVVGWLWIAMIWVVAGLFPAAWYDLPDHLTSPQWFEDLGPVAKASVLSVMAFFVGIAIQPFQRVLLMIFRLVAVVVLAGLGLVLVLFLSPWIVSLLVLVAAVVVTA